LVRSSRGFDGAILDVCANILLPLFACRIVLCPNINGAALWNHTGNQCAIAGAARDDDAVAHTGNIHESERVPLTFKNVNRISGH
jgi:hypothetical protein